MDIIEDQTNLSQYEIDTIEDYILGNKLEWYYNQVSTSDKYPLFGHQVMKRSEVVGVPGEINSGIYDFFFNIFKKFADDHNVKVNTVYRCSLNSTMYHPDPCGDYHVDHWFPHKNFIMYLTDVKGGTIIMSENREFTKVVEPKKYKAVIFDGLEHAQEFCNPGERRVVCVFTFD